MSIDAILLAGGRSSRMGCDKRLLEIDGRSFMDIQITKLCNTCAEHIWVSGSPLTAASGTDAHSYPKHTEFVDDIMPGHGPLGGLYSCLIRTNANAVLVITIDVPLISPDTLNALISCHLDNKNDATVLSAASSFEPLIAVYDTHVKPIISELISEERLAVRSLLDRISVGHFPFEGDPDELINCNSRQDYDRLVSVISRSSQP